MMIRTTTDLKMLRRTLGLSIDQAAELCEVKAQTIISHERGKSKFLLPRCIVRYTKLWNETEAFLSALDINEQTWTRERLIVVFNKQADFVRHASTEAKRLRYFSVHAQTVANFNLWNVCDWTLVEFDALNHAAMPGADLLDWATQYVQRYEIYKREEERVA